MTSPLEEAIRQTLEKDHRLTGIKLSRATTFIVCLCGAEFTGPDWWTKHLVDETTKAVSKAADEIQVSVKHAEIVVVDPDIYSRVSKTDILACSIDPPVEGRSFRANPPAFLENPLFPRDF